MSVSRVMVAMLLALASQTSCDDANPVAPTHGSIALSVDGLPGSLLQDIVVTGPTGSWEITTPDTVLRGLDPGTYTIESPTIWVTTGRWVPDHEERTLTVVASRSPATVAINYELWDSRLTLSVNGMPSGAGADVDLTGPSFSTTATHSQTFGDLKAGSYTVVANDVVAEGMVYRGTPATQTVTLSPGTTPAVVTVTYAAVTARLTISLGVLPSGAGSHGDLITITGPNGYSAIASTNTTLAGLAPGTYTLTARVILADGITYTPVPATQQVTLTAGATGSASLFWRGELDLQQVTTLPGAVYLTAPPDDPRLFIVQRGGFVRVVKGGELLTTPFLDLSARVTTDGERGLLSIAFDPLYATNGFVYAYFTDALGDITIERFSSVPGADVADPTPKPIASIPHRQYNNHNGGLVMFGPDGMLYAATGDGGSGGDPLGNGQNPTSLLGKMLRIDVRADPAVVQIWARGLRNPWRFDFRTYTGPLPGELYIADVGQGRYEEISVAPSNSEGLNYGWNLREGFHCYPSGELCPNTPGLRDPVLEYGHAEGCSIVGGFVYRGSAIIPLRDKYTFSDYCTYFLRTLNPTTTGYAQQHWSIPSTGNVMSFGEDAAGEQYIIASTGIVWKIVRKQ